MKRILGLLMAAAIIGIPMFAKADVPTVSYKSTYTSSGTRTGPVIALAGQNTCTVTTSGGASGYTVTVKGSSVGSGTLTTLTQFGTSGAITTDSSNPGNLTGTIVALTNFTYVVTGTITGTLTVVETCSAAGSSPVAGTVSGTVAVSNFPTPFPTSSPGGAQIVVPANASAAPYSPTNPLPVAVDAPDTASCGGGPCASPSPIPTAAATTTLVVTGVANQNIYVFYAGFQSTGATTALLLQYIAGTTVSTPCDTGTISPFGTTMNAQSPGAGQYLPSYAGAQSVGLTVVPSARPFKLPAGFSFCLKSSASAISGFPLVLYTIR